MRTRHVITGEAVALDLPAASVITRGASLLIDLLVWWAALALVMFLGSTVMIASDPAMQAALGLAATVLCLVILPVTVETLTRGRSVGKLVFGLRIVRDDGGGIRFRHSLIRGLTTVGEVYMTLGFAPLVAGIFTRRSQRVGDILAGTYAVRVRQPKVQAMMLPIPPPLAAWAQIADIGRIPDELAAQAGRLLRTIQAQPRGRMTPELTAISEGLAGRMLPHVSPPPPPGCTARDMLGAVMAERRNREYQRMVTQSQRTARLRRTLQTLPYTGERTSA